jgi:hypothetical protein
MYAQAQGQCSGVNARVITTRQVSAVTLDRNSL